MLPDKFWARRIRQAREVPSRASQTGYQPTFDRISHARHDNGNRGGGVFRCQGRTREGGHQDLDPESDQLRRQRRQAFVVAFRIALLNDKVLPLDVAEVTQPLMECFDRTGASGRRTAGTEVTDPMHFLG